MAVGVTVDLWWQSIGITDYTIGIVFADGRCGGCVVM